MKKYPSILNAFVIYICYALKGILVFITVLVNKFILFFAAKSNQNEQSRLFIIIQI